MCPQRKSGCVIVVNAGVVVAGIDGSAPALSAARWAACDAERRGATLRLVHAATAPSEIGYPDPILFPPQVAQRAWDEAARLLQWTADQLGEQHPGLHIETLQRAGSPTEVLIEQTAMAVVTVLGPHGAGQLSGVLFGSVAARVASHGQGRIVIARPPHENRDGQPGAVLLGFDGSNAARAAAGFAFEEAGLRDVPLEVIHTWKDQPLRRASASYPLNINTDAIYERERQMLTTQLTDWRTRYDHVAVRVRVVRGQPAAALLQAARADPVQLIVVGTRGRGGMTGLLLGSTSQAILAHAPCAVAVVHRHFDV